LALPVVGCNFWGDAHFSVYGPYRTTSDRQLVEAAAEAFHSRGYEVVEADTETGRVAARAHFVNHRGRTALFVVQCYEGGWMQLRVEGDLVRRYYDDHLVVPFQLRDEYVALAGVFSPALRGRR